MNHLTPVAVSRSGIAFEDSSKARHSSLADLLQLLGQTLVGQPGLREAASRLPVALRRVLAGQPLTHMGSPALALYFVHTGTFKVSHTDEDGYEQVLAFAGRGEVLAYDALCVDTYTTNAVALEDSTVFVVLRSDLPAFGRSVPVFEAELHRAGSQALVRTSQLIEVMAAVSSEVRLARFLLQHSRHLAANGQSPRHFILRMGRRDLASLLGVAYETVSRSFTTLSVAGLLQVNDRDIEILDLDALQAYSRCTRKSSDETSVPRIRRHEPARTPLRGAPGLHLLQA